MTRAQCAGAFVCAIALSISTANAKPRHQMARNDSQAFAYCASDQSYRQTCGKAETRTTNRARVSVAGVDGVRMVPHPAGCPHRLFCACGLAQYWGLGGGLNAVRTWPKVFARAFGPSVGIAAVRNDRHHVMGIIGGGPGAWEVVDFNSGGHQSRIYTTAGFSGYFFVDPRSKVASR